MNTTIRTSLERQVTVSPPLLTVLDTETGAKIHTALTPDERRRVAAALTADFDREQPAGGPWTRDDLPRIGASDVAHDSVVDGVLDTVLHWLNKHHPKPESNVGDLTMHLMKRHAAERTCDELRSLIEGQKANVIEAQRERDDARLGRDAAFEASKAFRRERDAAVERAEQAERERDIAETYRRTVERQAMDLGMAHLEKGGEQ